jgi:hypothetical protein
LKLARRLGSDLAHAGERERPLCRNNQDFAIAACRQAQPGIVHSFLPPNNIQVTSTIYADAR